MAAGWRTPGALSHRDRRPSPSLSRSGVTDAEILGRRPRPPVALITVTIPATGGIRASGAAVTIG
jgi:hypothetical protein